VHGNDIGVIGLAVMGRNLALNIADRSFAVAAFNRTASVTEELVATLAPSQRVTPFYSVEEFVESLERPRRIIIMVMAGAPVDAVIGQLEPLLEPGDIIMDGGNSHFRDTDRRGKALAAQGIHFFGVGISGGESGARNGPSLMPGGPKQAYAQIEPVLEAIAARANGSPCVAYLGAGAVGHFVKMVHNGIEYGVMQLIAETYAVMKELLGLSNDQLAGVYQGWHDGELSSYLLEITAGIFRTRDDETGGYLIDMIQAEAGQLGTGMWASQSALDLHVPVPNIDIAVGMRSLSALKPERDAARPLLASSVHAQRAGGQAVSLNNVREALFAAIMLTYVQGFALLQAASAALGFDISLRDVAGVWRAGCIIRSALLPRIMAVFEQAPGLASLLLDRQTAEDVASRRPDLVSVLEGAMHAGIPVPGFANTLAYVDAYRAEWWPFNLVQAQRDYFGSHQYRRTDRAGDFHTDWDQAEEGR
jgi:6-phosphogluconate dehydrogenase